MKKRHALGVALATGILCAPALAAPGQTTIRVEGGSAALIPEVPVSVDDAGGTVTVQDSFDADQITVPANSGTAQLGIATRQFGLPLGFQLFDFGTGPTAFVDRIGSDAMPASFSPSWRLTVNGRNSPTGSDGTILSAGDRVVWAFTSDFGARELDITVSGDRFRQGEPFTARVTSTDPTTPSNQPLVAAPAAGAVVTYGGQTQTANGNGEVSFRAVGQGVQQVRATRTDEVRSPARSVCSFTTDPAVCDLPVTPPTPGTETPGTASFIDNVPPGSRIRSVVSGRKYTRINLIRGTAGPDRSDVRSVDIAVARRIGTRCRYLNRRGVFGNARPCNRPVFLKANHSGTNWMIGRKAPFVPGRYLVMSRAIDGAGNRESRTLNAINTVSFTVIPPAPKRARTASAKTSASTKATVR